MEFIETLRKWAYSTSISLEGKRKFNLTKREKLYSTSQDDWSRKACAHCCKKDHQSSYYKIATKLKDFKKILNEKRLCFKCTTVKHRAAECCSKKSCQTCKGKHHPSLCKQSSKMMEATEI